MIHILGLNWFRILWGKPPAKHIPQVEQPLVRFEFPPCCVAGCEESSDYTGVGFCKRHFDTLPCEIKSGLWNTTHADFKSYRHAAVAYLERMHGHVSVRLVAMR